MPKKNIVFSTGKNETKITVLYLGKIVDESILKIRIICKSQLMDALSALKLLQ
jgi:hypothetical protein